jgi:hypothetical protein
MVSYLKIFHPFIIQINNVLKQQQQLLYWFNQCGKPFFSNTRQNGEWTETSIRQYEIELSMFGE